MITKEIKNWTYGIVDLIEPSSIKPGSISRALNFLTMGDRMELRRGSRTLGDDAGTTYSVGGIHVGTNLDAVGTQVLFRKRGRKLEYFNETTDAWVEIGVDTLSADAVNDDFSFASYFSQAGAQIFGSSPNSSMYKIMVANPGSITDLLATVYRGYIRVKQSRLFLWNRKDTVGGHDEQNPYLSWIDNRNYTTVSAEAIVDVAAGTLAFKAGDAKRTCFGIVITVTAGGEIYKDNRDGTLTGTLGGTGTINYTTGAFTTTAAGAGTVDYQWENSTSEGLADFSFADPSRVAATGNFFPQGDGGPLMAIETYGDVEYCGHRYKTYALTNGADDTNATNLIFRDNEGIPNWRAMKGTSRGIYYVNIQLQERPVIKVMRLQKASTAVDGNTISTNFDLSGYSFDRCHVDEFGDFIIFSCRELSSPTNNRFVIFNKIWNSFDLVDYYGVCSAIYNGALVAGDSGSGNVIELFSGVDDDDASIAGFIELNEWDLEYPGWLKACKILELEGNIGPDQVFDVEAAPDKGPAVVIGQIKGSDTYVDRTQRVTIGPLTLGRGEIGGGGDGIEAYHYFRRLKLPIGNFERVKINLRKGIDADNGNQEGIGYFSLSTLRFRDIRLKSQKLPRQYRALS